MSHWRMVKPWIECDMCGDYICTIHGNLHVHECECPDVDTWISYDLWPYDKCDRIKVRDMIKDVRERQSEAACFA